MLRENPMTRLLLVAPVFAATMTLATTAADAQATLKDQTV
jgi:hypothetical protein